MRRFCMLLLATVLVVAGLSVTAEWRNARQAAPAQAGPDLVPPVRAAFYYPWFDETWHPDDRYRPSLGAYRSEHRAVLAEHVAAMRYAGLDAAVSSWWGQGTPTDQRLPAVLAAAAEQGLAVAPYYEPEHGDDDPDTDRVRADLDHLTSLTGQPGWLHVDGRPVIFVYNAGATGCADVARWREATDGWARFYVQMKVFPGYRDCPDQPDAWHQYGPAGGTAVHLPHSFTVSPGYWHHQEPAPRLPRDQQRFLEDLRAAAASGARWQLVTSFNEWGEGTAVESAREWESPSGYGAYLDAMRSVFVGPSGDPGTPREPEVAEVAQVAQAGAGWQGTAGVRARKTVVWAVGDLCDNDDEKPDCAAVGRLIAGDRATTALVALGDLQYEDGRLSEFERYYDRKMGSGPGLKSRTHPVPGNHEWNDGDAPGYFAYWGKRAGRPGKGYYSRSLGPWRLLVVNSNCSGIGCARGSEQSRFLLRKLKRSDRCVMVASHHPAITDGEYSPGTETGRMLFRQAVAGRADLYLSGHDHSYQRFAPRLKSLAVNLGRGVPQFVVGTGGKNLTSFTSTNRSRYRQNSTFGALRLKLRPNGYNYRFVNIRGVTMDKGKGRCR